jgi:hypothetical protein
MKISRIDQIALNGGDGLHYKYEEVAEKILELIYEFTDYEMSANFKRQMLQTLVENFPNDET